MNFRTAKRILCTCAYCNDATIRHAEQILMIFCRALIYVQDASRSFLYESQLPTRELGTG